MHEGERFRGLQDCVELEQSGLHEFGIFVLTRIRLASAPPGRSLHRADRRPPPPAPVPLHSRTLLNNDYIALGETSYLLLTELVPRTILLHLPRKRAARTDSQPTWLGPATALSSRPHWYGSSLSAPALHPRSLSTTANHLPRCGRPTPMRIASRGARPTPLVFRFPLQLASWQAVPDPELCARHQGHFRCS